METIQLIQGTQEWHAHRAHHWNASDAPAMMGCGLKSRSELIAELHSSIKKDVSDYVQEKVFDPGHRFESLARPLAEKIIGEPLYPVTGVSGKFSASFDGLTILGDVAFEHKTLSAELVYTPWDEGNGDHLPLRHRVQMEHQMHVSGAERVLFVASRWTDDGQLIDERHCWYASDPALRAQIVAGWAQLDEDLRGYTPAPTEEPAPTGKTPGTLPALHIEVVGAVTASNLASFKNTALTAIRAVNRDLKNDQDFADADASIKWCADVESRLVSAKEHALSQTASIDELYKAIDDISAEARKVRLDLEKLVKARKEQIRAEIVAAAVEKGRVHIDALNNSIGHRERLMPTVASDYAGAIRGKRTLASLRDAADTELARFKIEANKTADRIKTNLLTLAQQGAYGALFMDVQALVLKQPEDLAAIITARIATHEANETRRKAREAELEAELKAKQAAENVAPTHSADAAITNSVASAGSENLPITKPRISGGYTVAPKRESIADANQERLLAAAQEMLTALKRAKLALEFAAREYPAMMDDLRAVNAAIQKAAGAV